MFVNIINFVACLPSSMKIRMELDFCSIEGFAGNIFEDDLFSIFDFSRAVTNNIEFRDSTCIIVVYDLHPSD